MFFIRPVFFSMISILFGTGFVFAAEVDDAAMFVEAFNAFQKKDYLLAIEKADRLNQVFPDSPLRDVTLLLMARSGLKSGDNELGAKTVNRFKSEFPDSGLSSTIEEDLLNLGARHFKGEQLPPNRLLQAAAIKTRDDRLAQERAAALKLEQEKIAKEKAERERIALAKAEAERRERERLAAEKAAKESIKAVISVPDSGSVVVVGQSGNIPVSISNHGKNSEEFLLEVSAAPEYGAAMAWSGKPAEVVTRIKLGSNETFKGTVLCRMPAGKVDGHRAHLSIKAVSSKYSDVVQVRDTVIIASAPLVRVVAKLAKPKVMPGEQLPYRVTLLNIGSLPAQDLTVRIQLPPELDLAGAQNVKFRQELDGTLVFRVEQIETGKLADLSLSVKVRENSRVGQELRGQVEVVNGHLQRKDIFTASASVVQRK